MNKLLKKKAVDGPVGNEDALRALSKPPSPAVKKASTSRWKKKGKITELHPRSQIDLTIALPSTDDFRTSLLMPSLSTRFSMLREQDDPHSLLGKACDDSVLTPTRRSRMLDFGYCSTGLADISEVASLKGSPRPPLAWSGSVRRNSIASEEEYTSDAEAQGGASIMGRARPGEGNTLFGGRQKIYKIGGNGAARRVVYDDDVGMSAFQTYRQREREEDDSQPPRPPQDGGSHGFDFGLKQKSLDFPDDASQVSLPNHDSAKDFCTSPSLFSHDRNRSTTSSDARSIARSSTAATSIASQTPTSNTPSPACAPTTATQWEIAGISALDRGGKAKRLYEPGLDQHLQEQQHTSMSRLHSIQRQRATSGKKMPPVLQGTMSASYLHDQAPSKLTRGRSPPRTSPMPSSFARNITSTAASSPLPGSPVCDGCVDTSVLALALEPGDRGKATAMGTFNKPARAFDEQQYLERQKQLQRSVSSSASKPKLLPQPSLPQRTTAGSEPPPTHASGKKSIRARSQSAPRKHDESQTYHLFPDLFNPPAAPTPGAVTSKVSLLDTHRNFIGNMCASDDEQEGGDDVASAASFHPPEYGHGPHQGKWQPTILPSVSEHPALRNRHHHHHHPHYHHPAADGEGGEREGEGERKEFNHRLRSEPSAQSLRTSPCDPDVGNVAKYLLSPPLRPAPPSVSDMNGIIHHLRQISNGSSVLRSDEHSANGDEIVHNSDLSSPVHNEEVAASSFHLAASVPDSAHMRSHGWGRDDNRTATEHGHSRQSDASGRLQTDEANASSWRQELHHQHARHASTETQEGRDAFARELAARREAVKENLRSFVEVNHHSSRATSPAPSPAHNGLRALGMIRAKTSRESLAHMPRSTKLPSLAGNASATSLITGETDFARSLNNSWTKSPMPTPLNAQHPAYKNDAPQACREGEEPPLPRRCTPVRPATQTSSRRSRSVSNAASSRSRSRHASNAATHRAQSREGIERTSDSHSLHVIPYDMHMDPTCPSLASGPPSAEQRLEQPRYPAPRKVPTPHCVPTSTAQPLPFPAVTPTPTDVYMPPRSATSPASSPAAAATAAGLPFPARSTGLRKRTITKHDISEPILISSTSNIDTVDLPPGASLKNGMHEAPPLPAVNPKRRGPRKLFGFGSKNSIEALQSHASRSDSHITLSHANDHLETPNVPNPDLHSHSVHEFSPSVEHEGDSVNIRPPGPPRERSRGNGQNNTPPIPVPSGMF